MAEYTQERRKLDVDTPLGKDVVLLAGFSGREGISKLFSYQLQLLADSKKDPEITFDKIIGKKVTIHLTLPDDSKRPINGLCVKFQQGERTTLKPGDTKSFTHYRAEIVPDLWKLTRKTRSRIFQQMNVPDILKKVIGEYGLDVSYDLQGTFYPRDYCVQYRETDFNFVSRLMEEEGIYYYHEHSDGSHNLKVSNNTTSHPSLPAGPTKIEYEPLAGGERDEDRITAWGKVQELRSGKVTLWDHCFELPHKHLEATFPSLDTVQAGTISHKLKLGGNDDWELFDYPGEYAQRFDGITPGGGDRPADLQHIFEDNQRTVEIRMEQEETLTLEIQAESNVRHLVSGFTFTLDKHFNGNGTYLITGLNQVARGGLDYRSGGAEAFHYNNSFTCIPEALPCRPVRVTPRPFVQGPQTAVVVGPKGEEIFTDKYGRVKVQFHWDREGKNDDESSCWIRVAQIIAGRRWGAYFWPRIGQEVIVAFQEGDPDQPIIVGCVYNADQMPPYLGSGPDSKHPNDNKLMGIKSNTTTGGAGFNEIRFDDTKDKQQVFLHAERNMDERVKSNSMESVGNDKNLRVGGEKDGQKHGDYKELIYRDRHIHVKRHQEEQLAGNVKLLIGKGDEDGGNLDVYVEKYKKETIGKDYDLHVKQSLKEQVDGATSRSIVGKRSEKVGGDVNLTVTGDRKEKVGGKQSLTVGASLEEKVGSKWAVESGSEIHLKGGMKVIIEGGVQVTLKAAGGFVDIGPAGVTIQGTMVMINSGGAAGSGSGSSPDTPDDPTGGGGAAVATDAQEAKPADPTPADDAKTGQKSN